VRSIIIQRGTTIFNGGNDFQGKTEKQNKYRLLVNDILSKTNGFFARRDFKFQDDDFVGGSASEQWPKYWVILDKII